MLSTQRFLHLVYTISAGLALAGCSTFQAYRIPIQQGNVVTAQHTNQLKLGMSKQQVTAIMGDPVLARTFTPDNWTYAYTKKVGGKKLERSTINLTFKNNRLVAINRD